MVGHFGVGNKDVKEWTSYSGYCAYYEDGPFRLKAELVGLVDKSGAEDANLAGYMYLVVLSNSECLPK
ncbi:MAG: hypothetical protein R3C26_14600 [Calditrichia bacterium]